MRKAKANGFLANKQVIFALTENIEASTKALNRIFGTNSTPEEYLKRVMFHELAHLKSNNPRQINRINKFVSAALNRVKPTNDRVISQLIEASKLQRPDLWASYLKGAKSSDSLTAIMEVARNNGSRKLSDNYPLQAAELLADGGAYPVSYTHLTLPTTLHECRSRWSPYH